MAFRGNQNRNRNFGGNYGGGMGGGGGANRMGNLNMSPWDTQNTGGNFGGGGNMRQGGGQGMNAQALNLANNLLNNLFRNQNPPSLLDLPRGGGMGNRNQRGGQMMNRGGGNRLNNNNNNNNNNRRVQGGFPNRGASGIKSNQKQGAGGIRKQNAFDRAKKLLAKNANNKKKDFAPGDKKPESRESPFANVPNDMFYCHLCKKHMWDATSFENHIKGRTHLMMREGIEESYRLKANMIRQEAKIAEQLKSIELDRLKRMGKTKQRQLEYCTMCDLNFHGHISAHRKSEGHLQLKKFLHPKCVECNNEFATRIDYDTHLLSADHLIKAAEKNTKVGERKRNTLTIHTEEEELKDVRQPQRRKKIVVIPIKKEGEAGEGGSEVKQEVDEEGNPIVSEQDEKADGEKPAGDGEAKDGDPKEGEEQNDAEEEDVLPPVDAEDCILDYNDGDNIPIEVDNRLPLYNWTRPVGIGLITKLECYECSVCGKFLDTEKTVEIHSRTVSHHRNFLKLINEKSSDTKIAQKRATAALEENERKKRRLDEAEAAKNGEEIKEEGADGEGEDKQDGEELSKNDEELYDPSEATGDDEDVEMAENGEGGDAQFEESNEEDGANGNDDENEDGDEEEEMETEAVVPELTQQQPVVQTPVKEVPTAPKIEVKQDTPIKTTPVKAQASSTTGSAQTACANTPVTQNQQPEQSPKKVAQRGGAGGAKNTPRGRGRGRYSRY